LDGQLKPDSSSMGNMLTLPVVFACEWPSNGSSNSVRSNNAKGAALAIEHLIALGHKNIGHVAGPAENVLTVERRKATKKALRDAGLSVRNNWFFSGDFSLDSGVKVASQWLAIKEKPSALFCASDLMAIGVISELQEHGVRVPDDISVVGFDDIDIARFYTPKLTTIRQPTRELGVTAAKALYNKLHGFSENTVSSLLDVELIVRGSTARSKSD